MAVDDLLKQAFGNLPEVNQGALLGGAQVGSQIANNIMQGNLSLYAEQQRLLMQQAQLRQQYATKVPELLKQISDDKTPGPVRKQLVPALSSVMQRAGFGQLGGDAADMLSTDPDYASAFSSLATAIQDPRNKDNMQNLMQVAGSASQGSWADRATLIRQMTDATKPIITELGHGMQSQMKLENSASLDLFKSGLDDHRTLLGNPIVGPLYKNATVTNPVTGKPMSVTDAATRVNLATVGSATPSSQDAQLAQELVDLQGSFKAQANEATPMVSTIQSVAKDIASVSSAGLTPAQRRAKAQLSNQAANLTAGNYRQAYQNALTLQDVVSTNRDLTERNRTLTDKAESVRQEYIPKINQSTAGQQQASAFLNQLSLALNNPNATATGINQLITGFHQAAGKDNSGQGALVQQPIIQKVLSFVDGIAGQISQSGINADEKARMNELIKSQMNTTNQSAIAERYQMLKTLQNSGGAVLPQLRDVQNSLTKSISNDPVAKLQTPRGALLDAMYSKIGTQFNTQDPNKIGSIMAQRMIQSGMDPIAVDNYIRMKKRGK